MKSTTSLRLALTLLISLGLILAACGSTGRPTAAMDPGLLNVEPGDPMIQFTDATITFDSCYECPFNQNVVSFMVQNTGTLSLDYARYELQYGLIGTGGDVSGVDFALDHWTVEHPFMPRPGVCPPRSGFDISLEPGETGYIWADLHLPRSDTYSGDWGWDTVTRLTLVIFLHNGMYPYGADFDHDLFTPSPDGPAHGSFDIGDCIPGKPMDSRERLPTKTPGPGEPVSPPTPVPTATKSPGIGG